MPAPTIVPALQRSRRFGLLAASLGLSRVEHDGLVQLDGGLARYDSFCRSARDATDETHTWPAPGKTA